MGRSISYSPDGPGHGVVDIGAGADSLLADPIRGFYVGSTGNVKITGANGVAVTLVGVPTGSVIPVYCTQVWASGTTASSIIGFF